MHSGQICMSTERILVHQSIMEPFTEALKSAVDNIFQKSGDAPILVASMGVDKNKQLLQDATSKGAKLVYGDMDAKENSATRMRPIIVGDVKKDMDLYYTESFGPTVTLLSVSSDEEALKIANDTEYGLSGAVFTKDLTRGLSLAKRIESGAIHINSMSVHDEPTLPHGGTKKSGFGRFNANAGLDEFVRTKTITFQGLNL
ncbi:hypothetical protein LTS18_014528 [Coniosporium uncinatum]|uniref:Uncharacterized protein n=1 Tax=Coniosporium uncinatum TaxID=93489 RepID=A0ACC3DGT1_9PEZI|nr:hypothetical protein LTS18_014528 [Coniosporium uncinatum]